MAPTNYFSLHVRCPHHSQLSVPLTSNLFMQSIHVFILITKNVHIIYTMYVQYFNLWSINIIHIHTLFFITYSSIIWWNILLVFLLLAYQFLIDLIKNNMQVKFISSIYFNMPTIYPRHIKTHYIICHITIH